MPAYFVPKVLIDIIINNAPWLIDFLGKIKNLLTKDEKIVCIETDELKKIVQLHQTIEILQNSGIIDHKIFGAIIKKFMEFFDGHVIIWLSRRQRFAIIKKESKLFKRFIEDLIKSKNEPLGKIIMVSSLKRALLYQGFKETPKKIDADIIETISVLPSNIRYSYESLLALSSQVEMCYESDDVENAENIRKSIRTLYKDIGIKFCNLYQRTYLKNFLKSLKGKDPITIQNMLKKFLEEETKNVFFIHKAMTLDDLDFTETDIRTAFRNKENYIAIHSLGGAIPLAKNLVDKIKELEDSTYTRTTRESTIGERNIKDFSAVWYKGEEGKRLFDFLIS